MKDTNVIRLVDFIQTKNKIKTFDRYLFSKKEISYKEHFGSKTMAFVLDFSLVMVIQSLIVLSYKSFFTSYFYQIPISTKKMLLSGTGELTLSLSILVFMTYFLLTPYLFEGKTLGLKIMKLRAVNKNFYKGEDSNFAMTLKESLHRTCGYVLGFLSFGLFTLIPFLTHNKKGLPDILSNTHIISEDDFCAHLHNHHLQDEVVTIDIASLAA